MELCFQRKDQDIMLKRKLSRLFPVGLAFMARGHMAILETFSVVMAGPGALLAFLG